MELLKNIIKLLLEIFGNNNEIETQSSIKKDNTSDVNDNRPLPPIKPSGKTHLDIITEEQFKKLFPRANVKFVEVFNKLLPKYNINTLERLCSFLAQCGHESAMFTKFTENLNYGRDALLRVWPRHFNESNVDDFARQPEKIANYVYGRIKALGNTEPGDGWKFRGQGIIQLTGRHNYTQFANSINKSVDDTVKYINTFEGRVMSAIWFWNKHNLNNYCKDDQTDLTIKINGGRNGLPHRQEIYNKAKTILKDNF